MARLVDTHCHIQSAGRDDGERHTQELWQKSGFQAATLVEQAAAEGVEKLMVVGCDVADSQLAVDFVQNQASCWAAIGIHPHEADRYINDQASLDTFMALATQPKIAAIGECGFDFYYNHSSAESQEKILRLQLDLAKTHNLPLIFHVREAFEQFWPVLDDYPNVTGVLHSFTDTKQNLEKALDRGLFIGVNGIATFCKDDVLLETYRQVPIDRLLLETDAPYLTPAPFRGNINEPKMIAAIAAFLADLRGETIEQLSTTTTANAQQLFGI